MNHILTFQIDMKHKCESSVEVKLTKLSFQRIERNTRLLDLTHTDICDFKSIESRDDNKYSITFINHCTKDYYVYFFRKQG